jgi:hypothetical protein
MKKNILRSLPLLAVLSLAVMLPAQGALAAPDDALNITKLLFVDSVSGLSQYIPKQGSRFAIGDTCTIYVETTGFTLQPVTEDSEDEFNLDLAVDLTIKMSQRRRVIASEEDFNTLKTTVRSRLPATFLAFSFVFDEDWNGGDYIIELTLRDNLSEQSVTQEMTYLLEEPTEADLARRAEENTDQ